MLQLNMTDENIDDLERVHKARFPFPDLRDPLYIDREIIISHGRIVAAGLARVTTEGIVIVDETLPTYVRMKAIRDLISSMSGVLKAKGMEDCHVFVNDDRFMNILKKLGFQVCQAAAMVKFL